jgi:uncharacterized protein (DUF3820 family)
MKEYWRAFKIFSLKSEAMWDETQAQTLGQITMQFGKYAGLPLSQIPLCYLDQTISSMPSSWFVRRVQEFVDLVMDNPLFLCYERTVPNQTFEQIQQEIRDEEAAITNAMGD